jgi:hypothetical protein
MQNAFLAVETRPVFAGIRSPQEQSPKRHPKTDSARPSVEQDLIVTFVVQGNEIISLILEHTKRCTGANLVF